VSDPVPPLRIVHRDAQLVVLHKPAGMAVHRSAMTPTGPFVLQTLRNQLGQPVFPVHRLDRPTRGLMVVALDADTGRQLQAAFAERAVHKTYQAIVRGWPADTLTLDAPLPNHQGEPAPACTQVRTRARAVLPWPIGRWPTARYAWVEACPETGRHHQIRRHLAHADFPLVGDRSHGDNRHNRLVAAQTGVDALWLWASNLRFTQPETGAQLDFADEPDSGFEGMCAALGLVEPGLVEAED
jgi:tRNA pseudouridine65 synthase